MINKEWNRYKIGVKMLAFAMMCMLFITPLKVNAATAGSWRIDYKKGAPSSVSNQVSVVRLSYYSGGYEAFCSSLSGTSGKYITISSSSAGGMLTQKIQKSGACKTWKMRTSTTQDVIFNVTAKSSGYCKSTGSIYIR